MNPNSIESKDENDSCSERKFLGRNGGDPSDEDGSSSLGAMSSRLAPTNAYTDKDDVKASTTAGSKCALISNAGKKLSSQQDLLKEVKSTKQTVFSKKSQPSVTQQMVAKRKMGNRAQPGK